ncbi:hypothetical protein fugu_010753 [Takifugu bimaculatus]|uniref:Uncharacterized protein n=1 Tax=Takifugu bimaculatus TaxID=433685 RepID=A0A4Z2CB46_9TELE|nr:hypothetical protein fugu_010753 [Takifugu bimaculatus]
MPCPAHYAHFMSPAIHRTSWSPDQRKMHIFFPLVLFIGSTSGKKQGDFGIFSACVLNNSLRLRCHYADCPDSPPYDCDFFTSEGSKISTEPDRKCRIVLPNHPVLYSNTTTSYNCTLTRRNRNESKHITIDYSIRQGKQRIRNCTSASCFLLHPAPDLLWPAVVLSLWGVLLTDGQPT